MEPLHGHVRPRGARSVTPAIRTDGLTKRYGQRRGLAGLDLEVHPGEVFGFLGPNGAGKTTTIRLLLDIIRPTSGTVEVLGMQPRVAGPDLRRRIGYLPGDFVVEGGQSSRELLTFLGGLLGGVPKHRLVTLADRLDLDLDARIRSLSKGNRQKVGLIQAFMHEPELLILDEPSSGLDPIVQETFLGLVREASEAGRTVFMSSHVLSEVQRSAHRVGIVRDGRMVAVEGVDTVRARAIRRFEIRFEVEVPADVVAGVPGLDRVVVDGSVVRGILEGRADPLLKAIARYPVASILSEEPTLDEVFLAFYRRPEGDDGAA
ncbi:MAG: ATP-binding cassette domain-containing protein [Chloroflexi bacterium]|nr:ATP-binding cassette domain-containing protein [Chloroflexota bacterium]